jgi:parvulin-like peptidyl-prolyl isomerase
VLPSARLTVLPAPAYILAAQQMKFVRTFLGAGILCIGAVSGQAELANAIQAIVHDSVITRYQVNFLNEQTYDQIIRDYRSQPEILNKKLQAMEGENLEKLLRDQLILHEFKTAGYNLPESVVDELVQERIKEDPRFHDRATFTKTLAEEGMTYERFRQQVRDRFIIGQLRMKNISSEIIISPHKMETYYQAHREAYKVEDEVKLRMIVLNKTSEAAAPQTRKLAEEVLVKLNEGAEFSKEASMYSDGSQRAQGGDWGWVQRSVLRKELGEVAFALKSGERSGVIDTPEACYLMLVEDKRVAHFKAIGEVRDQIEKTLLDDERNRLEKQWIEKLRKKTFVRYL